MQKSTIVTSYHIYSTQEGYLMLLKDGNLLGFNNTHKFKKGVKYFSVKGVKDIFKSWKQRYPDCEIIVSETNFHQIDFDEIF